MINAIFSTKSGDHFKCPLEVNTLVKSIHQIEKQLHSRKLTKNTVCPLH